MCGRFGLPPAAGTDAAPLLAKADADPGSSAIYVERLARTGSRVLTIRSDLRLVKPLVLGAGLTLDVAAGATLRLAAQPVLPKREVRCCAVLSSVPAWRCAWLRRMRATPPASVHSPHCCWWW